MVWLTGMVLARRVGHPVPKRVRFPSADRPCDDFTVRTGLRFHEAPVAVSLSRSASGTTRRQFVGLAIIRLSHITVLSHENIPQNDLAMQGR